MTHIEIRLDRRAVVGLSTSRRWRGGDFVIELSGPKGSPNPQKTHNRFPAEAHKRNWQITTDPLREGGEWNLRWYIDAPEQKELVTGTFHVPPRPYVITPGEELPEIPPGGYRLHPRQEPGMQILLILRSHDGHTRPASWHVTAITPLYAHQTFWFRKGVQVTEEAGSIQIYFPRHFDMPFGVPLPQGDYTVRWLGGLIDAKTFRTVNATVLASVHFRIDAEGRMTLIWWGGGSPE